MKGKPQGQLIFDRKALKNCIKYALIKDNYVPNIGKTWHIFIFDLDASVIHNSFI